MLELISSYSAAVITIAAVVHVFVFLFLANWARGDRKRIAQTLERFTDGLPHRSRMDFGTHLSDQIEAFLADIADVMAQPHGASDRVELAKRLRILDERREYLQSLRFETAWNVTRTMIESYPLAGVLGTILAIGAALAASDQASVSVIVTRFGDAIWSTFAGLVAAIVLMFIGSVCEPGFARLSENRSDVREMSAKIKRELTSGETTNRNSDEADMSETSKPRPSDQGSSA